MMLQLLLDYLPSAWTFLVFAQTLIKIISGCLLVGLIVAVVRFEKGIQSRYDRSFFSLAFKISAAVLLLIPSLGYFTWNPPCIGPAKVVVWSVLATGLGAGCLTCGLMNKAQMRHADAAICTILHAFMLVIVLVVGASPPLLSYVTTHFARGVVDSC
jgi:hypothetical protein